jgi:hypothetical protein
MDRRKWRDSRGNRHGQDVRQATIAIGRIRCKKFREGCRGMLSRNQLVVDGIARQFSIAFHSRILENAVTSLEEVKPSPRRYRDSEHEDVPCRFRTTSRPSPNCPPRRPKIRALRTESLFPPPKHQMIVGSESNGGAPSTPTIGLLCVPDYLRAPGQASADGKSQVG